MHFIVTPLLLGFIFDSVLSNPGSVIPTKEEQSNLLTNVEEVFNQVRVMVSYEGGATDTAVIGDVEKMVDRAMNYFALLEESTLIKLSCTGSDNSLTKEGAKSRIQKIIQEGEKALQQCTIEAANKIYNNSQVMTTITGGAMNQGQVLLDTLHECSKKAGLHQISCYKKVMKSDVFPLKLTLVEAIEKHKAGHMEAILIRNRANECVDDVLQTYQAKIAQILSEGLLS